jgi:two-component system sensor histidine kinase/response regulator
MRLHPLSLSFEDCALENEFKAYYDYENRVFNRIGIGLSFMGWFVLNIYFYFFYPQDFLHLTLVIDVLLYPVFFVIFLITAFPGKIKYYQPLTSLANCLAGLMFIYVAYYKLSIDVLSICGIMAVILFAFFILRLRFKIALLTTLIYVVAYQAAILLLPVHENSNRTLLSVIVWVIETVCIVGGYSMERSNRKMFCQTKEIIHQQQVAEAATRAKSEFLANMSHESRTPLNAIIGMTYLVQRTDLSTQQKDYVAKIQSSAQTLLGVINDILDFSKVEAGKMDIETVEFNLDEILTNLANLFNLNAQKKGIELLFQYTADIPQNLKGDPLRLGQILTNLISNAIKFTDKGEITVKIEPLLKNLDEVTLQFSVSDTGIGISKEQQNKLFQPFSQVDASTTRKYGGTGLGLVICERLVNLMGGKIGLVSEPDKGSTFFFTVKLGCGKPTKSDFTALPRPDGENIRVLVIDDNPVMVEILIRMLESMHLAAVGANSGEEGLAALKDPTHTIDLVLMDWEMPGMDGLETTRRILSMDEIRFKPKIIMISSCVLSEMDEEVSLIGINRRLTKPIIQSQLLDAVLNVFGAGSEKSVACSRNDLEGLISDRTADFKSAKILLVEDNEINQQVAKEMLHHMGVQVHIASNGLQAIDMLGNAEYDVVLMDVQMPVMDGYEATRQIRSNDRWADLPVIAMTAHARREDREKSLQAGMNDQVNKPINPNELSAALAKYIRTKSWGNSGASKSCPAEEETGNPPWPNMHSIKYTEGLSRLGGNQELYKKLLLQFRTGNIDTPDSIKAALAQGDDKTAGRLVHTVKGVAANIGANELAFAASELEMAMRNGTIADSDVLLERFISSLASVTDEIRTFEDAVIIKTDFELHDTATVCVNVDAVQQHLINLARMLESGSIKSVQELSVLEGYFHDSRLEKQFEQMKKQVDIFDMDNALGILRAIATELGISL